MLRSASFFERKQGKGRHKSGRIALKVSRLQESMVGPGDSGDWECIGDRRPGDPGASSFPEGLATALFTIASLTSATIFCG